MLNELLNAFSGNLLLEKLESGLLSIVNVEIANVLGDLTKPGIDNVFKYFDPLKALTRLDDIVVEKLLVNNKIEETDKPPNSPLKESNEMPKALVEVKANPMLVDQVKLAITLGKIVDIKLEPKIHVKIDKLLKDSTNTNKRDKVQLKGASIKFDRAIVNKGRLDVLVVSELNANKDVMV